MCIILWRSLCPIKKDTKMISKEYLEEEYIKKQRKSSDIAKDLGVSESTINNYRKKYNIPKNKRCPVNTKNLANQKFGNLTAINRSGSKNRKALWKCLCNCGKYTILSSRDLISGNTKSCGCGKSRFGKRNPYFSGYEEISGTQLRVIRDNALKRNIEYNISNEYIWDLFIAQNRKCALSNIELTFKNKKNKGTASLDRIDSSKGYIEGNVQWIHKHINKMKTDFNQDYFIEMCSLISKKNNEPQLSHLLQN